MSTLRELHHKTTSVKEHNKMLRSVDPLCSYFGVNHFFWTRLISQGTKRYFYGLGTHTQWHEFLTENIEVVTDEHHIRSPIHLTPEITLLRDEPAFEEGMDIAWKKFKINLTITMQRKIPVGIESFGFGVTSKHPKATQHLLNHLPLLYKFNHYFVDENQKLIDLARRFQVEASSLFGPWQDNNQKNYPVGPSNPLFKKLGLQVIESLSKREKEVLQFLAHGFPASYIADQLHLSPRTVEHHVENIKMKLDCNNKICLINKAKDLLPFLFL